MYELYGITIGIVDCLTFDDYLHRGHTAEPRVVPDLLPQICTCPDHNEFSGGIHATSAGEVFYTDATA